MEALNVLRIEKGFITHAEIDGRVTAFDLGMERMMSTRKDFVGKAAASRPGLVDPDREQLVGLRPAGDAKQILPGAFLFDDGDSAKRRNAKGWVTSMGYSPTLEITLALAFLKGGRDRFGDRVRMVDHLRGVSALCEVTDPVAFDGSGGRMRG